MQHDAGFPNLYSDIAKYIFLIALPNHMKKLFFAAGLLALAAVALPHNSHAQIDMPQASPAATLETEVGLTDVTVVYSRPGLKGRDKQIFGDLVAYDKIWRTGANESTKVTFSDDVKVEGKELPAGTYALYTIPGKDSWTVIFSKQLDLWGDTGYKEEEDALRVSVKPVTLPYPEETFTIDFSNYQNEGAEMDIIWDYTKVPVSISSSTDEKVMAQIEDKIQGNYRTYFDAANYYLQTNRDLDKAEEWINKAISLRPHYAFHHLKAKILAAQGKTKEALKEAETSKKLASENNNPDYVRMNETLIAQYSKRK